MSKLGISIKIDVTKIDKSRIFEGKKGKYLDLTTFIDTDNVDQYENNGFISQETTKDERDKGIQTPILGNCKVFYNSAAEATHHKGVKQVSEVVNPNDSFDNDILPF